MEVTPQSARASDGAGRGERIVDAVASSDAAMFADRLADDVIFRSPVARFRFQGKDIAAALFETLVTESDAGRWKVQDFWDIGDRHFVAIKTSLRGHELDLLIVTLLNERGQIREVIAYGRPLASIAIFPAFVYPHLVERFRGRTRAKLVRLFFRPFPRMLEIAIAAGLGLGQPPEAEFDANLPAPKQSPPAPASPPPASRPSAGPAPRTAPPASPPPAGPRPASPGSSAPASPPPAGPRSPWRRV